MSDRYKQSEQMLERALKTIPLGTQTFSKSKTQYPKGVSPFYIERGQGSHIWDVDGNEYVDFINGLDAITLGYSDEHVNEAVTKQLKNGVSFSLPHSLEYLVSEKIVEMVPSAEMVRYGKNGSDATAGAIRLARAFTQRDHVIVCGYHGWQDWYIGSTARNLGVPKATQELTHVFLYNDLDSLDKVFKEWPDQIAAVIMEPMNIVEPEVGFLESVKKLTHKNGALLIFDETVTGFRFSKGGAQEYFNVNPDLTTLGKGLANGFPLSAVVGRADIMKLMEEIFFSFTFGGETLSLAAALATMTKVQEFPVIETMYQQGNKVMNGVNELIRSHGVGHFLRLSGNPTWSFILLSEKAPYSESEIKTLFLQEMFARGILILGTHNMNYAHSDADIDKLLTAYDEILPILKSAVDDLKLKELLHCEPLVPLFKLR